jgi:hypothetical protein
MLGRAAAFVLLVSVVGSAMPSARAEVYGSNFRSSTWRVDMTVPRDWELTEQASYPGILAYATHHKGGGRMTLAVQRLDGDDTLKTYVERNDKALRKIGYRVSGINACRTSHPILDATTPDKQKRLVQAYLNHDGAAYVLTLAARSQSIRSYMGAFCDTLGSLTFGAVMPKEPQP